MTGNKDKRGLDTIIGKNIRIARKERNISMEELGNAMGLTVAHVGLVERGLRGATATSLWRLSQFLNVSIDSLFVPHDTKAASESKGEATAETARKKIQSLLICLDDNSMAYIVHTIKGLIAMRKDAEAPQE